MSDDPPTTTPPAGLGLPPALEQLLAEAANDDALRQRLFNERAAVLAERGLSPAEHAVLAAVTDEQLGEMLERLAGQPLAVIPGPPLIAPTGIRPDHPDGLALVEPVRGARPEPVRGTRAGRLVLTAAVASAVAVGGVMFCSLGVRPDRPEHVSQPHETAKRDGGAGTGDGSGGDADHDG